MKVVAAFVFLLCLPVTGWANRVALVIGNSEYTSVVPLENPQNDSDAVSNALRAQGFEVLTGNNLGRVEMRNTLRRFRALADRSEIALIYYAGHGIEIGGTNYLIPTDARLEDERDAGLEMVEVDLVLRQISGAKTLRMVVLDACRNNPFVFKMQRQGGNRNIGHGLGEIRSNQADTLISYAAAAGEVTPDGLAGENSPFTTAFLAALSGPPMDIRRMLGRVRDQMRQSVPGAAPFVYSSLGGGEYVINPRSAGPAATTPDAAAAVGTNTEGSSISLDFVRIDRAGNVADWNDFLIRYEAQSTHPLYAFALEKHAALQREAPLQREATAPEANLSANPVANVMPPTAKANDPTGADGEATSDHSPAFAVVPTMTVEQAAQSLQSALKDRGCYFGRIDGLFGRNSKRGLAGFSRQAGTPITLPPSPDASQLWAALEIVRTFPDVKCPRVARRSTPSNSKPRTSKAKTSEPSAVAAEPESEEKKPKIPVLSTLPCPKAEDLKFNRPECH